MKTLKKETLHNGIVVELVENKNNYQIIMSDSIFPETVTALDKAVERFNKRVKIFSRFCNTVIDC